MESDILVVSDLAAGDVSPGPAVSGPGPPPLPPRLTFSDPQPVAPQPVSPQRSASQPLEPTLPASQPSDPARLEPTRPDTAPAAALPLESPPIAPQVPLPPPVVSTPPIETPVGGADVIAPPIDFAAPSPQAVVSAAAPKLPGKPQGRFASVVSDAWDWVVVSGVWWLISAMAHTTVLLLALLVVGKIIAPAIESAPPGFEAAINAVVDGDEPDLQRFVLSSDPIDSDTLGGDMDTTSAGLDGESGEAAAALAGQPREGVAGLPSSSGAIGSGPSSGSSSGSGMLGGFDLRALEKGLKKDGLHTPVGGGGSIARRRAVSGGVVAANDVGQAVDGVLKGIRGELEKNDVLVCWLIDASISLADDRQLIAERVEPFFHEIEAQDKKKSHRLMNSVVAFSDTTWEVIKPTDFSSQIVQAIRNLPLATTGIENVMTAIQECIDQYGRKWKGSVIIVVWTDESGDDILQLEEVIRKCKRRGVLVSVVGPTAVLGSEQGRHYYVDKGTGFAFLIPIKRGPDTSLPERLFLPYWHDSPLAPWSRNDVMAASGVPWYGGPHREGLLSGVGPYALTRVALETGGTFTLLDRKEDRGPFKWEVMKNYLPDYASAADYVELVNSRPLRKAVSGAVMSTYQTSNLVPPATAFVLHRSGYYPYSIYAPYYTPEQFRSLLFEAIPQQQMFAKETNRVVEQALSHFPKDGMEYEYLSEHSLRWKAWYDLNRGRLLAMSVRQLEYVLACEKVLQPGYLKPDTNHLVLKPSSQYLAGSIIEPRAREAFRLLKRCVEKNAGTPWAMLAQWELDHELGIEIQQIVIPVPKPSPSTPRPPEKPIVFPNL